MGDRSPKSNQKNAAQKQARNDAVANRKNAAITAQRATKAKLVPPKEQK